MRIEFNRETPLFRNRRNWYVDESGVPTAYTIRSGDSLSQIAIDYYGDWQKYVPLHNYNRARGYLGSDPNVIQVGEQMLIPPISELYDPVTATTTPPAAATPADGYQDILFDTTITAPISGAQAGLPAPPPEPFLGLSKKAWLAIGLGATAITGGVVYYKYGRKKTAKRKR